MDCKRRQEAKLLDYITEPYQHQHQVVLYGLEHPRVGILCDMGTGKTKAAIDLARNRAYQAGATRDTPFCVLVIAPKSILGNWKREIEAHSRAGVVVLKGTRKQRLLALQRDMSGQNVPRDQKAGLWQITSGYVKDEDGRINRINAASKLKELGFLVDEISGQAIIWCRFTPNIKAIAEMFVKRREGRVTFFGETAPRDRDAAIESFQNGKARFFIGQTKTGGMGINLTARKKFFKIIRLTQIAPIGRIA